VENTCSRNAAAKHGVKVCGRRRLSLQSRMFRCAEQCGLPGGYWPWRGPAAKLSVGRAWSIFLTSTESSLRPPNVRTEPSNSRARGSATSKTLPVLRTIRLEVSSTKRSHTRYHMLRHLWLSFAYYICSGLEYSTYPEGLVSGNLSEEHRSLTTVINGQRWGAKRLLFLKDVTRDRSIF
jgi:hypothetical protein